MGESGQNHQPEPLLGVKSKFDAEFRRFSISTTKLSYEEFERKIRTVHKLITQKDEFIITYSCNGDLLPINNNDNFYKAVQVSFSQSIMRVFIHRKNTIDVEGFGKSTVNRRKVQISTPKDFRPVSAIIDVDILPETLRRVRLHKHGSDKPLGFYIRDGVSVRLKGEEVEKVQSIFISRLVSNGLAAMTGLLAIDDEVLEVNSIEVTGKTLDQVTDMMVANAANLIITVKPASQKNNIQKNYKADPKYPKHVEGSDSESDEDQVQEISTPQKPKGAKKSSSDKNTDKHKSSVRRHPSKVIWRVPSVKNESAINYTGYQTLPIKGNSLTSSPSSRDSRMSLNSTYL